MASVHVSVVVPVQVQPAGAMVVPTFDWITRVRTTPLVGPGRLGCRTGVARSRCRGAGRSAWKSTARPRDRGSQPTETFRRRVVGRRWVGPALVVVVDRGSVGQRLNSGLHRRRNENGELDDTSCADREVADRERARCSADASRGARPSRRTLGAHELGSSGHVLGDGHAGGGLRALVRTRWRTRRPGQPPRHPRGSWSDGDPTPRRPLSTWKPGPLRGRGQDRSRHRLRSSRCWRWFRDRPGWPPPPGRQTAASPHRHNDRAHQE